MESSYIPRPEDFRLAWPNAYRITLLQVGEMQVRADDQLKKSEEIILTLHDQAEFCRKNLHRTGTVVIDELRQAGIAGAAVIKEATDKLIAQAERLVAKDRQMQDDTERRAQQLAVERRRFEVEKKWLFQQPLWRRVVYVCKHRT
jgi:hypothetical protein